MPRNRITKRDASTLTKLVDRYGTEIISDHMAALPKRAAGRPKDANLLPRSWLRWEAVTEELRADPNLKPSPAAARVAKKGRHKERTLRSAYAKIERLRQVSPEFNKRALLLYYSRRIERIVDRGAALKLEFERRRELTLERLKPLDLYHPDIINAIKSRKRDILREICDGLSAHCDGLDED
jgi:hypothetical protein